MNKIKVGIAGAAGYTGGELMRLLLLHPKAELVFAQSRSHAGKPVSSVHSDLLGDTDLIFTDKLSGDVDVIFMCLAHGEAKNMLPEIGASVKVIDLSQDFRPGHSSTSDFVYGLPELNRDAIKGATRIANPGCFATAIQLALLPAAKHSLLNDTITVNCTTGSTGAGKSLSESSHFSWRQNNLSVYKAFTHQHLAEIHHNLKQVQSNFDQELWMFPQRGAFTRGILACLSFRCSNGFNDLKNIYRDYYKAHPFVYISDSNIDLKQVVNTNKCLLYLEQHHDQMMIVSIIDNLLKGAAGQAVQNMNLMFGLEETTALKLKASAF